MEKSKKRYCLERLIENDPVKKISNWQKTNKCSDDLNLLVDIFLVEGYRVFDELDNKVVITKADLSILKIKKE
ncbi:hypothetical protein EBB07_28965 [Paenibacillaceae bacterium]|nr:hypothetical protein EBB07_28965 [Paenibacillaceae bacterium]